MKGFSRPKGVTPSVNGKDRPAGRQTVMLLCECVDVSCWMSYDKLETRVIQHDLGILIFYVPFVFWEKMMSFRHHGVPLTVVTRKKKTKEIVNAFCVQSALLGKSLNKSFVENSTFVAYKRSETSRRSTIIVILHIFLSILIL